MVLLQPHRTVIAKFVPGNFGLFRRNPWQPLAEPRLKNTIKLKFVLELTVMKSPWIRQKRFEAIPVRLS